MSRSGLILVSGLPASGKSSLAIGLADRIGAVALSRDQVRQELKGRLVLLDWVFTRLTGRYRRGLQEEATRRLATTVADELGRGRAVVVEVVADRFLRRRFEELAADHEAPVYWVEVICSEPSEFARRLRARSGHWQRTVARMSKSYEPAPGALASWRSRMRSKISSNSTSETKNA